MGDQSDGSWKGEGTEAHLSLTRAQNEAVKTFHQAGVERRPAYDEMMRRVVRANQEHGMVLVGDSGQGDILHSLKGLDSLRRKVASELRDYEDNIRAVLADIKDLHRYSSATEPVGYSAAAEGAVNHLQSENAVFIKFKNTWDDPVYKGVNTVVTPALTGAEPEVAAFRADKEVRDVANTLATRTDPTDLEAPLPAMTLHMQGQGLDAPCEFQMHTPGNLRIKDLLHLPYELQRSGLFETKFGDQASQYVDAADHVMASKYNGQNDVMPQHMDRLKALTERMNGKSAEPRTIPTPAPEVLARVNRMLFAMEALQNQPPLERRTSNQELYRAAEQAARPAVSRSLSEGTVSTHQAPPQRAHTSAPQAPAHAR
ncbi:hypothetical protein ACFVTC_30345 [Streptomyces sp. NPDC057950]|uniref:hypothetical protein n=1 Tax=Streptomyces sp. NPDC057950 TaxID=3346288 RepID=UPI0036F02005